MWLRHEKAWSPSLMAFRARVLPGVSSPGRQASSPWGRRSNWSPRLWGAARSCQSGLIIQTSAARFSGGLNRLPVLDGWRGGQVALRDSSRHPHPGQKEPASKALSTGLVLHTGHGGRRACPICVTARGSRQRARGAPPPPLVPTRGPPRRPGALSCPVLLGVLGSLSS